MCLGRLRLLHYHFWASCGLATTRATMSMPVIVMSQSVLLRRVIKVILKAGDNGSERG